MLKVLKTKQGITYITVNVNISHCYIINFQYFNITYQKLLDKIAPVCVKKVKINCTLFLTQLSAKSHF